jgi:uncharacterized phage protein (TIGR01671 family)
MQAGGSKVYIMGGRKMRAIRFRGKRMDNGEWLHGDLITERNKVSGDSAIVFFDGYMIPKSESVLKETLGQYTGLKDKNSKEIYEGDIIKEEWEDKHRIGVVKYGTEDVYPNTGAHEYCEATGFHIEITSYGYYQALIGGKKVEVIGNIYEHPHLLEESK